MADKSTIEWTEAHVARFMPVAYFARERVGSASIGHPFPDDAIELHVGMHMEEIQAFIDAVSPRRKRHLEVKESLQQWIAQVCAIPITTPSTDS